MGGGGTEDEDIGRDHGLGFEAEAPGVGERVPQRVGGGQRGGEGFAPGTERGIAGIVGEGVARDRQPRSAGSQRTGRADSEADAGGVEAGSVVELDGHVGKAADGEAIHRRILRHDHRRLLVNGDDLEELLAAGGGGGERVAHRQAIGSLWKPIHPFPRVQICGFPEVVALAGLGGPMEMGGLAGSGLEEPGRSGHCRRLSSR